MFYRVSSLQFYFNLLCLCCANIAVAQEEEGPEPPPAGFVDSDLFFLIVVGIMLAFFKFFKQGSFINKSL